MEEENYYKVLSIPRDATIEEIKQAHRQLVRDKHPDLKPNDPEAEQEFMRIQQAYETLSNPEKRQEYDAGRSKVDDQQYDPQQEAEAADLDTIFGAVFGKRRQG